MEINYLLHTHILIYKIAFRPSVRLPIDPSTKGLYVKAVKERSRNGIQLKVEWRKMVERVGRDCLN